MNELKKTVLYDYHIRNNAKMVEYANYEMPVSYTDITNEHLAVRNDVGLFDVSHMGEILVEGVHATEFLDYVITSNIEKATPNKMVYGLLLDKDGFIIDDLMVYKYHSQKYLLVVNCSNKDKDFNYLYETYKLSRSLFKNVVLTDVSSEFSQLALQGPNAYKVLSKYCSAEQMTMFDFKEVNINNFNFIISRSGYTGEDGFEIYGSNDGIYYLFGVLIENNITLCGLGCRDTLRFEAGMPLYGHEINYDITPFEACLTYAVDMNKDFIGKLNLLNQPKRKLIGLELKERKIARSEYKIVRLSDLTEIGYITTGYLVPKSDKSLFENPIALGLVNIDEAILDSEVGILIRKSVVKAVVRNRKFMNKKYVK